MAKSVWTKEQWIPLFERACRDVQESPEDWTLTQILEERMRKEEVPATRAQITRFLGMPRVQDALEEGNADHLAAFWEVP